MKKPCGHMRIHNRHTPAPKHLRSSSRTFIPFQPIRITMDYSYINGSVNDPLRCTHDGQEIWWLQGYNCSTKDIITEQQQNIIIQTLENVKTYFEHLLSVQRLSSGFYLENYANFTAIPKNKFVENVDMYVTPVLRPFGNESNTIASAGAVQLEESFSRPILS